MWYKGHANGISRFAFVEYESRRDADDAYHEMHNKRIGRDDVLKIEVSFHPTLTYVLWLETHLFISGLALLHRRHGASIPGVTAVGNALPHVAVTALHLHDEAAITRPVRTTVATVTLTVVRETVLAALMTVTVTGTGTGTGTTGMTENVAKVSVRMVPLMEMKGKVNKSTSWFPWRQFIIN